MYLDLYLITCDGNVKLHAHCNFTRAYRVVLDALFFFLFNILFKKNSEYDEGKTQSQTANKPMAPLCV